MSDSDGFAALDGFIERVRSMPDAVRAYDVAPAVEAEVKRQIAAGTDPDGTAWQPTKRGEKPLATAATSVGVAGVGKTILIRVWGHVARHHLGRAKGGIERPIIPTDHIPKRMGEVIREQVLQQLSEHMEGK